MIAFTGMLVSPAERAGIEIPADLETSDVQGYPHWVAYRILQLGRPIVHGMSSHWENAEIIAKIPRDEILKMTLLAIDEKLY